MPKEKDYTSLSLPKSIIKEIADEIDINPYYTSTSEFIKEAIRSQMLKAIELREGSKNRFTPDKSG